jgi:hypothetical protein
LQPKAVKKFVLMNKGVKELNFFFAIRGGVASYVSKFKKNTGSGCISAYIYLGIICKNVCRSLFVGLRFFLFKERRKTGAGSGFPCCRVGVVIAFGRFGKRIAGILHKGAAISADIPKLAVAANLYLVFFHLP